MAHPVGGAPPTAVTTSPSFKGTAVTTVLSRPGTAHGPSGNWELDHEPLSDLEVVRQHHPQHPRLLCPAVTEHVLWACRVLGTKGTDTAPPAGQRVGRHVDSTGESQGSAGGRWAALTLLRHNKQLRHKPCGPPRTTPSRQAPGSAGGARPGGDVVASARTVNARVCQDRTSPLPDFDGQTTHAKSP